MAMSDDGPELTVPSRAREVAEQRWWRLAVLAGALALALAVALLAVVVERRRTVAALETQRAGLEQTVRLRHGQMAVAQEARARAESQRAALQNEQAWWEQRVGETQAMNDLLFRWAVEEGQETLPPLQGRRGRLEQLAAGVREFIEGHEGHPGLRGQVARARFQLAEIALALGDAVKAQEQATRALRAVEGGTVGPVEPCRLARFQIGRVAVLVDDGEPGAAQAALVAARRRVSELDEAGRDRRYFAALLDFYESRLRRQAGDRAEALALLRRSTRELNELAEAHPQAIFFRTELATSYRRASREWASVGEGEVAGELRQRAAEALLALIKARPLDPELRLELAGCYGAMAESAVVSGHVQRAEAMARGALELLEQIRPQRASSGVLHARIAAQKGLIAGILRDRGEAGAAMALYDEAAAELEPLMAESAPEPEVCYRYALLTWQRGRMLGFAGRRGQELGAEERAVKILAGLRGTAFGRRHRESIDCSLAYLYGDLGHARQQESRPQAAAEAFQQAAAIWEALVRQRPQRDEYLEALDWNRQRLEALE